MRRDDDRSPEHLLWLVEQRSANQKATLELLQLLTKHDDTISGNIVLVELSQELAVSRSPCGVPCS